MNGSGLMFLLVMLKSTMVSTAVHDQGTTAPRDLLLRKYAGVELRYRKFRVWQLASDKRAHLLPCFGIERLTNGIALAAVDNGLLNAVYNHYTHVDPTACFTLHLRHPKQRHWSVRTNSTHILIVFSKVQKQGH